MSTQFCCLPITDYLILGKSFTMSEFHFPYSEVRSWLSTALCTNLFLTCGTLSASRFLSFTLGSLPPSQTSSTYLQNSKPAENKNKISLKYHSVNLGMSHMCRLVEDSFSMMVKSMLAEFLSTWQHLTAKGT